MLNVVIYLVIGGLGLALLIFLFIKVGKKEFEASPQYTWEKAVKEYGDAAIANLFHNAKSDEEKVEIAAFVTGELAKRAPEPQANFSLNAEEEAAPLSKAEEKKIVLSRLESITISQKKDNEESVENTKLSMNSILSAPPYRFWQEAAINGTEEQDEPGIATEFTAASGSEPQPSPENDKETTAICSVCGNPFEADYDFCIICGTKTGGPATGKAPAAPEGEAGPIPEEEFDNDADLANTEQSRPVCASCDESVDIDDVFCGICGAGMTSEAPDKTMPEQAGPESPESDEPLKPDQSDTAEPAAATEPARCPLCGEVADTDNAFCIICGTPLPDILKNPSNPFAQPAPDEAPHYAANRDNVDEEEETEKNPFATPFSTDKEEDDKALEHTSISLQDILNNVRALEEKIIAEATDISQQTRDRKNKPSE